MKIRSMKPIILITNDDGINAKGLGAAIDTCRGLGRLVVVAPEESHSGMSHSLTITRPLSLRQITDEPDLSIYACTGTPVDCVKIAIDMLMDNNPSLLVSGVNHGSNSNISVVYSGTMGAASEGILYGIPSVGLSLQDHSPNADFEAAKHFGRIIIDKLLASGETHTCLNVNFPKIPLQDIKGIKACRQTKGCWHEEFDKRVDPHGREYYWLAGKFFNEEPEATDTDEWALENGYVSVVPVQLDMTDYKALENISAWNLEL